MKKPKVLILHATGTNRDFDLAQAFEKAGGLPEIVHINQLRLGEKHWQDYQLLALAGGFSYADALGAGRLLAIDLTAWFNEAVHAFIQSGKPVIGICNGFQALVKAQLLPALADAAQPQATLSFNEKGHFECRWVTMQPVSKKCIWTRKLTEEICCPVAHGEGNFITASDAVLSALGTNDQIALTYNRNEYPANPNGSVLGIAGVCNPQGNVLGLMPHPENNIHPWQNPARFRGEVNHSGLALFQSGVGYAQQF